MCEMTGWKNILYLSTCHLEMRSFRNSTHSFSQQPEYSIVKEREVPFMREES